jgi:hypothetical protein
MAAQQRAHAQKVEKMNKDHVCVALFSIHMLTHSLTRLLQLVWYSCGALFGCLG